MATTSRLSTKGQLVLPKSVRDRHRWVAGTELVIEDLGSHVVVRAPVPAGSLAWRDLVGAAGYRGPRRSLADMEQAITEESRGQK